MSDLIAAHLAHCRSRGLARTTIHVREKTLRRVDRDLPCGLEQATVQELEFWLGEGYRDPGSNGWKPWTRATHYGHIRAFFRWACDPRNPILDYDPAAALNRPAAKPGAPRPASTDQLEYALTHLGEPWRGYVLLAAAGGLRCFEIATIRREDITVDSIHIQGKGGKLAAVPTHPLIWATVKDLPPGPLARPVGGHPPTAQYISARTAWQLRRLGLDLTLHKFRHWLGTTSLRAEGGNLRKTQELLRHASVATTAIYTQITDEERRAAIHALPIRAAAS